MDNVVVVKYELNQEYWKDLLETYWKDIVKEIKVTEPKKITHRNNNFIMIKQLSEDFRKNLVKKIGFTYFWYLEVLLDTVDYNNKVNFNIYKSFWVSPAMIKVLRSKFKEIGFVKRFWNDFYINPHFVKKWDSTPLYVIDLFKE